MRSFDELSDRKRRTLVSCAVLLGFFLPSVPASSVQKGTRNRHARSAQVGLQTAHETDRKPDRGSLRKIVTHFFTILDYCFENDTGMFLFCVCYSFSAKKNAVLMNCE